MQACTVLPVYQLYPLEPMRIIKHPIKVPVPLESTSP